LCVKRPPTTLERGKNASGQEAFGSKAKEALVEQSPAISKSDMPSPTVGTRVTAASTAEKVGASTAPPTGEEKDDLCMTDPRPTLDPQTS
jgi:hypothetical protein